jgi:hypothetical protein
MSGSMDGCGEMESGECSGLYPHSRYLLSSSSSTLHNSNPCRSDHHASIRMGGADTIPGSAPHESAKVQSVKVQHLSEMLDTWKMQHFEVGTVFGGHSDKVNYRSKVIGQGYSLKVKVVSYIGHRLKEIGYSKAVACSW